jgi:hypothetical protein
MELVIHSAPVFVVRKAALSEFLKLGLSVAFGCVIVAWIFLESACFFEYSKSTQRHTADHAKKNCFLYKHFKLRYFNRNCNCCVSWQGRIMVFSDFHGNCCVGHTVYINAPPSSDRTFCSSVARVFDWEYRSVLFLDSVIFFHSNVTVVKMVF